MSAITSQFPGVYSRELDFSDYAELTSRTILGLVGVADKGPLHRPTIINNEAELVATFGLPPNLKGGQNEKQRLTASAGSSGTFKLSFDGQVTATVAYNASASTLQTALQALSTIGSGNAVVTGGGGLPWVVTFTGALAQRDVAPLLVDTQPTGGTVSVSVVQEGVTPPGDYAMIAAVYFLRQGRQLRFVRTCEVDASGNWLAATAQTRGAGLAEAIVYDNTSNANRALVFKANSPGEWANSLRIEFSKMSGGSQNEKQRLVFSDVTSARNTETFRIGVNGTNTADISFNNAAATLQSRIKTAIEAVTFNTLAITVNVTGSGTTTDPVVIEFTGATSYTPIPTLTTAAGAAGTTYAGTITVSTAQEGVTVENDVYRIRVLGALDKTGTVGELERFENVMLLNNPALLAANNAYYFVDAINTGIKNVGRASAYVVVDTASLPAIVEDVKVPVVPGNPGTATYRLFGGYSALNTARANNAGLTAAAYIGTKADPTFNGPTGLQTLDNAESIDISLVAVPGVTINSVLAEVVALTERRRDCFAILDTPSNLSYANAIDWHNKEGAFSTTGFEPNSSYAGIYWPWVEVYDPYNENNVFVPPSVLVPGVFAYTDRTAAPWFAPAGETRGVLGYALRLESVTPPLGALESLYGGGNVINPIIDFFQRGIAVYGQRTTQRKPTALDRIGPRRMLTLMQKTCARACRVLNFELNDESTWNRLIDLIDPVALQIKNGRGLIDYKIVCDRSTNPPALQDAKKMRALIFLKPTPSAEVILLDYVLVSTGADFSIKVLEQ